MNHPHYQELTSQFIDRELGPEGEAELFGHLGTCAECREFLKESVRLQADLAMGKFKAVMSKQVGRSQPYAPDRPVLASVSNQAKYARVRTAVLLVMIVLIAGLFWSTTLPRQNPDHFDQIRQMSPAEIPTYQP